MKKSVLFVLHLPPPIHGAAMMGKYIHDSNLVNRSFSCHYINLTTASAIQDIGKCSVAKLWHFCKLLLRIVSDIRHYSPELVYVTPNAKGMGFYKDFIVVQLIKRMGCRVIAHYHNTGVALRQDCFWDNLLYRKFFKNIKVILLADVLYQDMSRYVSCKDVYICPNGIPEMGLAPKNMAQDRLVPHLLFLSNLLEAKGVFVLLDALKILKDKGFSFSCSYVGGETNDVDKDRFNQELLSRGLKDCVRYNGSKFGEAKLQEYANADIFVFPSLNEAFPLVLLEAMQFHLPVVASNVGGGIDIVKDGETGFIVPPGNSFALSEKIAVLLKDTQLREKMAKCGYDRFREHFTLAHFEHQIVQILQKQFL